MKPETVQLVLAVFGLSGLLGAIIAVVKLRPEGNERAVGAALNAVNAQDAVLEEVKEQRDYWKAEVTSCHEDLERARERCRATETEMEQWRTRALDAEAKLRERGA